MKKHTDKKAIKKTFKDSNNTIKNLQDKDRSLTSAVG